MAEAQVVGRPAQKLGRSYGVLEDESSPTAANSAVEAAGDDPEGGGLQRSEVELTGLDGARGKDAAASAVARAAALAAEEAARAAAAGGGGAAEGGGGAAAAQRGSGGRDGPDGLAPQTWTTREYGIFVAFGMGSSWLLVNACYLQLAIYQREFGLMTSNRMTIGYDVGTLALVFFLSVRIVLRRMRKGVNYRMLITGSAAIHFLAMLWCAIGVRTVQELVLLNFLGGFCGYLAGVVHQGWMLMHCHNALVAAFWVGDALASVLAAFLAILQQPELSQPRFGPRAFYCLLLPFVPLSLLAFLHIERHKVGALPEPVVVEANAGMLCLDEEDSDEEAAPQDGQPAEPQKGGLAPRETSAAASPTPAATRAASGAAVDVRRRYPAWQKVLPPGARGAKAGATALLAGVVFWSQFANWGVLDSISPYSCQEASPSDGGESCVFVSTYGTLFGGLIATHAAVIQKDLALRALLWPFFVYCAPFPVLVFAAMWGGVWASPLGHDGSGGMWIAVLVTVMRTFGPMARQLVGRMVQTEYEPRQVESMNFFLTSIGTMANFVGVILTTIVLETVEPVEDL